MRSGSRAVTARAHACGAAATASWAHLTARGVGPAKVGSAESSSCRALVADTRRARVSAARMAAGTRGRLGVGQPQVPAIRPWERGFGGRELARMVTRDPDTGDTSPANEPDARAYDDPADWAEAMGEWVERTTPRTAAGCERMSRPPRGRQGPCGGSYRADDSGCTPPCLDAKGLDDFLAIDPEDYRHLVEFGDNPREVTPEEQDLFLRAWGVIIENYDLVEWARCAAMGGSRGEDCYRTHFFDLRGDGRVKISMARHAQHPGCADIDNLRQFDQADDLGASAYAAWGLSGGHVNFCDNVIWRGVLLAACSGYAPSLASATFAVAMVLVHEFAHICSLGADPNPDRFCYNSYMIGGAFGFALGTRYGAIVSDPSVASTAGYRSPAELAGFWGNSGGREGELAWPFFLEQVSALVYVSHEDYALNPTQWDLNLRDQNAALATPC